MYFSQPAASESTSLNPDLNPVQWNMAVEKQAFFTANRAGLQPKVMYLLCTCPIKDLTCCIMPQWVARKSLEAVNWFY